MTRTCWCAHEPCSLPRTRGDLGKPSEVLFGVMTRNNDIYGTKNTSCAFKSTKTGEARLEPWEGSRMITRMKEGALKEDRKTTEMLQPDWLECEKTAL